MGSEWARANKAATIKQEDEYFIDRFGKFGTKLSFFLNFFFLIKNNY